MIDVHQRPEILRDPRCDASELRFLGVGIGMPAVAVPTGRIVEVSFSPLAKGVVVEHGGIRFDGFDRRPVGAELLRDSVIHTSGVLHTDADVSFTVRNGRVARVTLHGSWMEPLRDIDAPSKLVAAFGRPDRCFRTEADGDLIGHDCFYATPSKWVRWLASRARPSVVMFGGSISAFRPLETGGISRRAVTLRADGGAA